MVLAGSALLFGLWAGLLRLGWDWAVLRPTLPMSHGPLMVCGFLGTLILLERAVALQKTWVYLGVAACGLGGVWTASGAPGLWGPALMTAGSVFLTLVFLYILRQHLTVCTAVMAIGAVCWLIGNVIWLVGAPVNQIVLWWAAFLIFTVAGERLELSRVTRLTVSAYRLFGLVCLIALSGLAVMLWQPDVGWRTFGLGLLALSTWLFRFDVARRTVRMQGLPRYIAWCLLTGYAWLGVSGFTMLVLGVQYAGLSYDLILHAIFIGFVISMVFGHAPIILPAVLNLDLAYAPVFYLPLALLHSSLLIRVSGDLLGNFTLRKWGGLLSAVAILLFLSLILRSQLVRKTNISR